MAEETKELAEQPKTLKFQSPKEVEVLNASLGGVPGVDYSRMAKEVKTPEQVASAEGQLYQQIEPQRQRLSEMEAEKARIDTANKAMYAESEAAKVYQTENQRKRIYDENPYPKLNPTKENIQSLATLFSLIGVVGIGLGGRGKMSAMNSLNSMTGIMKGWQQGRADLFKKDLQEFEKNMNSIKSILDAADKEADRIYKLLPVDRAKAESEMAALTASLGGQILKQKTQLQGIEQGISFIKDLKKTGDDAWERAFKEKKETREAEHARTMEKLKEREISSSEKLRLAQIAATQEMKRANLDYKDRDKILSMTQGVRGIESLMTQLKDPDVKAGLQAKVAPLFEKLTSAGNAEFENAVNNALTGTDKTTLFLKDALLETYAIERAAKGGQRLTVQDMKMVGPVLDPTNYKPDTYMELLNQRRKVLYNNLQDMGVKPEQIKQFSSQRPYESFDGSPPAQKASKADVTATAKANNLTEDEAKKRLRKKGFLIEGE